MKTTTFTVCALGLVNLAIAQPHHARHFHLDKHVKRDGDVVVTVIDTVYAAPTAVPDVIVYVDQFGNPFSTVTEDLVAIPFATSASSSSSSSSNSISSSSSSLTTFSTSSTPSSSPSSSAAVSTSVAAPVVAAPVEAVVEATSSSSTSAPVSTYTPAPVETTSEASSTSSATPAESSTTTEEGSGFGFSYSPYNSDNSCKTQDQVNTDFDSIPSGYGLVRIYGTDCNQVATVLTAAKAKGLKLFAGIYDLSALSEEVALIVSAAGGDWSSFDTISVGNELVNSGTASASAVVAAIGTARTLLKAAGYSGKVVTVDTLVAARSNPSLCDASDYCTVNCHPFFDGNTAAEDSGSFLTTQIPTLRAVLANQNQEIVITETGWPWKGETNGAAVPSTSNQAAAISSIKTAFSSNPEAVILFSTFNDMWKTNTAAQFAAEQYWGFLGDSPSG